MRVAVIGASNKPERYSNQAVALLKENGHEVFPVHPALPTIEGIPVHSSIRDVPGPLETVTMYVGPKVSTAMTEDILAAKPKRIIFNPGAENPTLKKRADDAGIETLRACTLVLLRTGQF